MRTIDVRDLIAGALLMSFGVFVALYASANYNLGTLRSMGAGYFPVVLGWILAGIGAVLIISALYAAAPQVRQLSVGWRPLLAILAAVLLFSQFIETLGLVPTTVTLALVASLAGGSYRWRRSLALGVGLALISWLIFKVGLNMPLPAFGEK